MDQETEAQTVWVTSARSYNFSSWGNSHTRPQTSDPLTIRPLAFPYRTLHLVNKLNEEVNNKNDSIYFVDAQDLILKLWALEDKNKVRNSSS